MNKLIEVKQKYKEGKIDKWKFIDEMYNIHAYLFDYAEFLKDTNISLIEIENNRVIMKFRDSEIKFICNKNDKRLAALETLNFGEYEREELELQLKLIKPNDTILDIGGNFGWYSTHVSRYKPDSKILTFEPVPSSYKFLNENIRLNNLKNITTYNFAFSDEEGLFDFYVDPSLSGNASLANISSKKDVQIITCKVKRLDEFASEHNINVDFIKCDVEGAELMVFKGGFDLIKNHCPIIFTEMLRKWTARFNYHPNDIIIFFQKLGYSCFSSANGHLLPCITVDENTIETNFFFLHKTKHTSQIDHFLMK
jgi:FkbM family methyltransferase